MNKRFASTDFICSKCGTVVTLTRPKDERKVKYNQEDIWCYICKEVYKHYELRDKDLLYRRLDTKSERTEVEEVIYSLLTGKID